MPIINTITLVTVCDDGFVVLLASLLKSIEVNLNPNTHIDLYVVGDNVKLANKKKLLASIDPQIISINWLTIDKIIPEGLKLPLDKSTFPSNVYARIFIPYFVPEHIEKVLYLDVDMIVTKDLTELWRIDIGDCIVAGVLDHAKKMGSLWSGMGNYKDFGLSPDTKLFNSGLLLLKPIEWRKRDIARQVIICIEANAKYAVFPDQYGLNMVLANQWFELDYRWNYYASQNDPDPYLIHFTGIKPIYRSYAFNPIYRDEFYKYLRLTQWHNFTPISGLQRDIKKAYTKIRKKVYALIAPH